MSNRPKTVLCIEDSAADSLLVTSFLGKAPSRCVVHFAEDGEEGRDYLQGKGKFAEAGRPDIILLDLNLPRYDGREILREVKQDPTLRHIPVIVLTTSSGKEDVRQIYGLGANAYFTKPTDLGDYEGLLNLIGNHWLGAARLPDAPWRPA
jgi:CheY-like chemotaxis protein